MYTSTISLHDRNGQRKYLNQQERTIFLRYSKTRPVHIRLFCELLLFTGGRISEIHNLSVNNIDFSNKTVILETLKRRKRGIYREIPIPDFLLADLESFISAKRKDSRKLWSFSLRTASRYVKSIMIEAGISGKRSTAKGLRHGFAVIAVQRAPITTVKKWLGHCKIESTEVYLDVIGVEERKIAEKVWTMEKEENTNVICE